MVPLWMPSALKKANDICCTSINQSSTHQLIDKDSSKAISLFWATINGRDGVDSALKDMAVVMKQLNRSDEAIEAIKSFYHLCPFESQDSLDNVLVELYKVKAVYVKNPEHHGKVTKVVLSLAKPGHERSRYFAERSSELGKNGEGSRKKKNEDDRCPLCSLL